jgi:hypothetical protein
VKCSDPECPYGLDAYSDHEQFKGKCLNCLDDERRDDESTEVE